MTNLLQDRDGNTSSKRVAGYIMLSIGILEKVCLFCVGLKAKDLLVNFANLDASSDTLITAGAGLLGICVLEFFGKKDDKVSSN